MISPITCSFGKGKKGNPQDPQAFDDLHAFAQAIKEHASVKKFPLDIDRDEYKRKKDRGPWVMRAICEATALDEDGKHWHRRRGAVVDCDWLMFDADKMPFNSYGRVRRALKELGVGFAMYRSTGNNLECKDELEAFRVLIPCWSVGGNIAEAVSAHLRETVLADATVGGEWDPACDQPTRIIYLPFEGADVDVFDGDLFNCADWFSQNDLTLVERGRDGLQREEKDAAIASFGPFADFVAWCLLNVPDAVIIRKPDGRIALQMPGQQGDQYSGGEDGGDGWNFYSPSGDYDMLVFHSLHELTEPEGVFGVQDAIGVLTRHYGGEAAQLYAQASREAAAREHQQDGAERPTAPTARDMVFDEGYTLSDFEDLPECGPAPHLSELTPMAFVPYEPAKWPTPMGWDKPEEPIPPGKDAPQWLQDAFAEKFADWLEVSDEWDRQYDAWRIECFQYFNQSFVYVSEGSRVANMNYPAFVNPLGLRDFVTTMAPFQYWGTDDKGKPKKYAFADTWIQSQSRQTAHGFEYAPGQPRIFRKGPLALVNRFYLKPFDYTDEEDLLDDFFWLVDRTHPHQKEGDLFLDWLAFSFRYPQERILWAYVNISEARGSGRGTLLNAIKALLGNHNVTATDVTIIDDDKYHDWMFESLVVAVEEADEKSNGGRVRISGQWNDAITSTHRLLNLKSRPQVKSDIYCNMAMFLNSPSIIIDAEDRRINAVTGAPAGIDPIGKEKASQLSRLFRTTDFRNQLASWLWRRDLTDFDYTHSDRSLPARSRLLSQSSSVNDEAVEELIAKLPSLVVPVNQIHAAINKVLSESKILKPDAVVKILQAKAFDKKTVTSKEHGSVKCYLFDDPLRHGRGWAAGEMNKCYKSFMR